MTEGGEFALLWSTGVSVSCCEKELVAVVVDEVEVVGMGSSGSDGCGRAGGGRVGGGGGNGGGGSGGACEAILGGCVALSGRSPHV